jgi:hypothetical protein
VLAAVGEAQMPGGELGPEDPQVVLADVERRVGDGRLDDLGPQAAAGVERGLEAFGYVGVEGVLLNPG